jgi:hypothetical protein
MLSLRKLLCFISIPLLLTRQTPFAELSEFGCRETSDPDEADRRRLYKVEKWDADELHVEALLHAPPHHPLAARAAGPAMTIGLATSARWPERFGTAQPERAAAGKAALSRFLAQTIFEF